MFPLLLFTRNASDQQGSKSMSNHLSILCDRNIELYYHIFYNYLYSPQTEDISFDYFLLYTV